MQILQKLKWKRVFGCLCGLILLSGTCNADIQSEIRWMDKWPHNSWSKAGWGRVKLAIYSAKKAPTVPSIKTDLWVYIFLRFAICEHSSPDCLFVNALMSRAKGCGFGFIDDSDVPSSFVSSQECVKLADNSYQLKLALMQIVNGKTSFPLTDYIETDRFISRVIKSGTAETSNRDHWLINPDTWQKNHDIGVATAIACDNGDRNACARLDRMLNKTENHNRSLDRAAGTSKAITREQRKRQEIYRQNEQYRAYPVR